MSNMSRNTGWLFAALVALCLGAFLAVQITGGLTVAQAASASTSAPAAQTATLPRTITVVGQGNVTSQPDVATATVGVEVSAPTVKEATSEAADKMDEVLAALKAQGVADKDIQTSNYSIHYDERHPMEMPAKVEGNDDTEQSGVYRVSNMVNIKIRDLDKVAAVIDAVVEAGVNSLWGVNFAVDDTSEVEAEARAKAVSDATDRAEELAKLSNVKLGHVVEITEVIGSSPFYAQKVVEFGRGGGGGPISPGELELTTQVQVTFAIE